MARINNRNCVRGSIYLTRCLVNGKCYIGFDSKSRDDYYGSGKLIRAAIKKYGLCNFERIILDSFSDAAEGFQKEMFWIKELCTKAPAGYNLTEGGEGGMNPSEQTRLLMSLHCAMRRPEVAAAHAKSVTGKKHTAEHRAKMSQFMKEYSRKPEVIAARRARMLGPENPMRRAECREKISGDSHPMKRPEVAARASGGLKLYYSNHPEEREKMKARMLALIRRGDANPMKRRAARDKISGHNHWIYKNAEAGLKHRERMRNSSGIGHWSKRPENVEKVQALRQAQSDRMKGRTAWNKGLTKETDERVASYSKSSIGRVSAMRDLWRNEEYRGKMISKMRDYYHTPEGRAHIAKMNAAHTEEMIAKQRASLKASWAKRKTMEASI